MKMLLNFTDAHPAWSKAKGRVLTKCLLRPVPREYDAGCEINNILSCTLDVLTEVCFEFGLVMVGAQLVERAL